ncbi:hypothetical protein C8J30_10929 [Rhodobacter viridis]|uniref:Uncharacterized protein n=1 Tax=Rhodobacter viridis TaxID=1054202 RepID=A0A318TYA6_9RHOB|nr:hypothetical protein C8J30_10929 [Rhodobacter viridis]
MAEAIAEALRARCPVTAGGPKALSEPLVAPALRSFSASPDMDRARDTHRADHLPAPLHLPINLSNCHSETNRGPFPTRQSSIALRSFVPRFTSIQSREAVPPTIR